MIENYQRSIYASSLWTRTNRYLRTQQAMDVVKTNKVPRYCRTCKFYGSFVDVCWLHKRSDKWTCEPEDFLKYLLEIL